MPWLSKAQARWGHSPSGVKALGGESAVHEWDAATPKGSLSMNVHHPGTMARAKKKVEQVNLGKKSFEVHKGGLHKALGVPEGKKIPAKDLEGHHSGHLGHMIASAKGFKAMHHGK